MQILCCTDRQHVNAVMMFLMYLLSVGERVIYCCRFSTITVLLLHTCLLQTFQRIHLLSLTNVKACSGCWKDSIVVSLYKETRIKDIEMYRWKQVF